ncbi:c-type cytochrome [Rhodohalobacter halophilus]|uniref:c-type cytochrome n=1 Tax=Rhodohalobacter halophilus TaxID=1812810 RepID=UPI00083F9A0B|nr:c-type cytochrome [Rhodohalobacter halophilus]
MKLNITRICALLLISVMMISCRGQKSEKPPIHPQQNMDFQDRFNAQEENRFFADGRSMRTPVEGTVARGQLRHDTVLFEGVDENGEFVDEIPFELTESFLYRGQDKFEVYCQMCHGGTGDGQGIIMTGGYGYVPAPTFHREASYNMPDGEIYSAIANGIRNMPSYASQIKVEDRWAIVAYVRALQRSQNVQESEMGRYDVDLAQLRQADAERRAAEEERAAQRAAAAGEEEVSAERGQQLITANACNACHSVDGTSLVGPTFEGLYGAERNFADGSSTVADEEYIRESIVEPGAKIVEGYDNVMAPYGYLSDGEIQSIIEYLKTLSDN